MGVELEVKDIGLRANCSPLCSQPNSAKRNFDAFRTNLGTYTLALECIPLFCKCTLRKGGMHWVNILDSRAKDFSCIKLE